VKNQSCTMWMHVNVHVCYHVKFLENQNSLFMTLVSVSYSVPSFITRTESQMKLGPIKMV